LTSEPMRTSRFLAPIGLAALAALAAGCASKASPRTTSVTRLVPTRVVTHVITHDAKLIGTAVGGVRVTIRDVVTNRMLAEGRQLGGTGDTKRIMQDARGRTDTIYAGGDGARYEASFSLSVPTLVDITAEGPLDYPDQMVQATKRVLLLPGQEIGGDGVVLELHGYVIDLMGPDTTRALSASSPIAVRARVRMICSCPTQPGGMWEVNSVVARLVRDSAVVAETKLTYAGEQSIYSGELGKVDAGSYRLEVIAASPSSVTNGVIRRRITVVQ
jgi:hypothetical protein